MRVLLLSDRVGRFGTLQRSGDEVDLDPRDGSALVLAGLAEMLPQRQVALRPAAEVAVADPDHPKRRLARRGEQTT